MNIVIIGQKGAGKSTLGAALAEHLGIPAVDTDAVIEELHKVRTGQAKTCREIFTELGVEGFREIERQAIERTANERDWSVVITGGGAFMDPDNRRDLRRDGLIVYLTASLDTLWARATATGIPATLGGEDPHTQFADLVKHRHEVMLPFADVSLDTGDLTPEKLVAKAADAIAEELAVRCRAANTYGELIRMTSFGESHGPAIGCVLDGMRPGIPIDEAAIQAQLDRRRPGQSNIVTQRKEPDSIEILSGVFEGKTTGAPIGLLIRNQDQKSQHYEDIRELFRPGHADFTFYKKYGIRDHRGGGRSSARETAMRVAVGAIARTILAEQGVQIYAHAVEIASIRANTCDYAVIETNPVRCADSTAAEKMEEAIRDVRKEQDSVGGIVQLDIIGLPIGLGDPVFYKLDARLTSAIMTVGAFKGVEVGDGFALTKIRGSQSNDNMVDGKFTTNHGGGITGGISTGQPVRIRIAVKPTASIAKKQNTLNTAGENTNIETKGRHDPCIVPRAVPVIENVAAHVLLDAWEIQQRLNPNWTPETLS